MRVFYLLLFFSIYTIEAQTILSLSPGIKLGYALGENGGFVFGFEASLVVDHENRKPNQPRYGFVVSIESINDQRLLHLGLEANFSGDWSLFGLEVGPTFILEKNKEDIGVSITPYFGGFIIPYLRYNIFPKKYYQIEAGTFLKLHIPVKGEYTFN